MKDESEAQSESESVTSSAMSLAEDPQRDAARLSAKPHGRYIITPDSAPAMPTGVFSDVTPEVVTEAFDFMNRWEEGHHDRGPDTMFLRVREDERQAFLATGEMSAKKALAQLDAISEALANPDLVDLETFESLARSSRETTAEPPRVP